MVAQVQAEACSGLRCIRWNLSLKPIRYFRGSEVAAGGCSSSKIEVGCSGVLDSPQPAARRKSGISLLDFGVLGAGCGQLRCGRRFDCESENPPDFNQSGCSEEDAVAPATAADRRQPQVQEMNPILVPSALRRLYIQVFPN